MHKSHSLIIAGSTLHTRMCAEAFINDKRFHIQSVLTPGPKRIGRDQVLTKNPMQLFAEEHGIPLYIVEKKIDLELKKVLTATPKPDFLLVVDFGYYIPEWLLNLPSIAPLNIHPSLLPRWRGSSPGQFVLLNGEKESAVTLMIMGKEMDQGPVITQLPLRVQSRWNHQEYYQESFSRIAPHLANLVQEFIQGKHPPRNQPVASPTPLARRLTREDGYIEYKDLQRACTEASSESGEKEEKNNHDLLTFELLQGKLEKRGELGKENNIPPAPLLPSLLSLLSPAYHGIVIDRAIRALTPWPGVWTILENEKKNEGMGKEIGKGNGKRCKVLSSHFDEKTNKLVLDTIQIEGKEPKQPTLFDH